MPYTIQEEQVRAFFSECGTVTNIRIIRDKYERIGKGFGYVTFGEKQGYFQAIVKDGDRLEGRKLRIRKAVRDTESSKKHRFSHNSAMAHRRLTGKRRHGDVEEAREATKQTKYWGKFGDHKNNLLNAQSDLPMNNDFEPASLGTLRKKMKNLRKKNPGIT